MPGTRSASGSRSPRQVDVDSEISTPPQLSAGELTGGAIATNVLSLGDKKLVGV